MSLPDSDRDKQHLPFSRFTSRQSFVAPFPELPPLHDKRSSQAVVTWIAGENAHKWFSITGPAMKRYAERIGADFIVLEGFGGQPFVLTNKFRVRQVFEQYKYERVLYVDADLLLTEEAINYFELVPEDEVGILDEGHLYDEFMLIQYQREAMMLAESQGLPLAWKDIPSPKNSGLYVMSYIHSDVLLPPSQPFPLCGRNGATVEQTWLGLSLHFNAVPLTYFKYPDHHWVWFADQDEKVSRSSMALHFAGLPDGKKRLERLMFHADRQLLVSGASTIPEGWHKGIPSVARQMTVEHSAMPALKITSGFTVSTHRYGWKVAMMSLSELSNSDGILFDGFIEDTFLWNLDRNVKERTLPYVEPWLGFIHHPPHVPDWPSIRNGRLQRLLESKAWIDSKKYCLGLFAMSDYLRDWVRDTMGIACETVRYPTLVPESVFSWEKYLKSERLLVNIGFWLRRFSSFHTLNAAGHQKVRLINIPTNNTTGMSKLQEYEADEENIFGTVTIDPSIRTVSRVSSTGYDELLSKSVVFLDLIDASAVTVVVECLTRGTPLLVNRHPAVVEYLGEDYPLFFDSIEEAGRIIQDVSRIKDAHEHMKRNPIASQLIPTEFVRAVTNTEIYKKAVSLLGSE
jgi:hypothetical protein